MKKAFDKVKMFLTALWIAIISFFSKAIGQYISPVQPMYGVEYPIDEIPSAGKGLPFRIRPALRIISRLLILITFIVGIINLIKIRKIDDKTLKKKKIKKTIIIFSILIILIIACFITTWL